MNKSETIGKLAEALSAFQGEMSSVPKNVENTFFRSKYADLTSIWDHIRKPLTDHGLAIIQTNNPADPWIFTDNDGKIHPTHYIEIETMLVHTSGEFVSDTCRLPLAKVDPQGAGSAITYARRYGIGSVLGLVSDDDDDGNAASGNRAEQPARGKGGNNKAMDKAVTAAPAKPTPAAPVADPVANIWGHGAASDKQDEIVAICKALGAAGDAELGTHKALDSYVQERFDEPLAKLSVKSVKILIEELNERLAERQAMQAEGSGTAGDTPTHSGPEPISKQQLDTITKLCDIKNYGYADCALEYSNGESDDLAKLTNPQAVEAIKKVQKMAKITG